MYIVKCCCSFNGIKTAFNTFSRSTCQSFATHFWVATHSLGNAASKDFNWSLEGYASRRKYALWLYFLRVSALSVYLSFCLSFSNSILSSQQQLSWIEGADGAQLLSNQRSSFQRCRACFRENLSLHTSKENFTAHFHQRTGTQEVSMYTATISLWILFSTISLPKSSCRPRPIRCSAPIAKPGRIQDLNTKSKAETLSL